MAASRVILITAYNPYDVSKWSGTLYSIFHALTKNSVGVEVLYIRGPLGLLDWGARIINKVLQQFGSVFDCHFSTAYAMLTGAYLTVRLLFVREGTLLAIAGSNYVAYLKTRRKIIYISDATVQAICELYPAFQKFPAWLRAQGSNNEAKSLAKSRFVIYSSRWASESARTHYHVSSDRIFELPFGPNIPDDIVNQYFAPKSIGWAHEIKILFVSADWKRKNGGKVIDICRFLIAAGIKARLILIGDTPEYAKQLDFVDDRGFLRKSDPTHLAKLCEAYREAHFFVLPTEADASPIVFSEAQAFGVPPVTHDVGGTGSAVVHRQTGLLLPLGASAEMFAAEIIRYVKDAKAYHELSQRCRQWYIEYANWSNWSTLILRLAQQTSDRAQATGGARRTDRGAIEETL